ncbi:MAG: hypothetical protein AAGH76_04530 [Pseudomonadota bacterium]
MRALRNLATLTLLVGATADADVAFEDYDYERWSQAVTGCDILASHGRDPGHVSPGVSQSGMDKPAAIAACQVAVANDPDNPRLNYLLGRAYGYSGRSEDAMPYRNKALAADYPQSTFTFGYLHLLGLGVPKDPCLTLEYWQRSAKYKRLAALVSLPRHYLRGDFDSCEVELSASTLTAYLTEARAQSSDYYVGLLIEDLEADLSAR